MERKRCWKSVLKRFNRSNENAVSTLWEIKFKKKQKEVSTAQTSY
jgi:hypothetical protein